MMRFAHVASRAFDRPLLLEPRRGMTFLATLAGLISRSALESRLDIERPAPAAFDDDGEPRRPTSSLPFGIIEWSRDKTFAQVDSVAVLEIDGTLVNKNGSLGPYCGMTGYDGIRTQLMAAMIDPTVKGIALYIESPGGEVAGCFDLANFIRDAAKQKPIWAIVDGLAASAAYALASGCNRITASSVGLLGSIGVIVAHADYSKMLAKEGIDVTLIYAGAHKADGNPFEALPASVRKDLQAEINALWTQFAALVALGRGVTPDAVKKLEARCFLADDAAVAKLCDVVMPPDEALSEFIESVSR
jgi:signal peptide peptidase SppA